MRYPCSYMIYSDAFDALPAPVRDRVYGELKAKLQGTERQAVLEILRDTKQTLPAGF